MRRTIHCIELCEKHGYNFGRSRGQTQNNASWRKKDHRVACILKHCAAIESMTRATCNSLRNIWRAADQIWLKPINLHSYRSYMIPCDMLCLTEKVWCIRGLKNCALEIMRYAIICGATISHTTSYRISSYHCKPCTISEINTCTMHTFCSGGLFVRCPSGTLKSHLWIRARNPEEDPRLQAIRI